MLLLQRLDSLRVFDCRVHLESVADDPGIAQQPRAISRTIPSDSVDVESVIRGAEVFFLLEDGQPGKPGLIDLEDQPLKEQVVVMERKAILGIVIGFVENIFRVGIAASTQGALSGPSLRAIAPVLGGKP